jgi:ankyrin repeat protein
MVKQLLAAGADIRSEFEPPLNVTLDVQNLFSSVINDGAEDVLQFLLEIGAHEYRRASPARFQINHKSDLPLLEQAVLARQPQTVRALLDCGFSVNGADGMDSIALSMAITLREDETVNDLLLRGADANMSDQGPWRSPLCAAVASRSVHLTELLLDYGAQPDPIGSLVNVPSALHLAVEVKSVACVQLLIEHGADVNKQYSDCTHRGGAVNRTPMSQALVLGHSEIVKLLLEAGVKPTSLMLHDCITENYEPETGHIIKLLLEHGADLNAEEGWDGRTALEEAVALHNSDVVEILLRFNPIIDFSMFSVDYWGRSIVRDEPIIVMLLRHCWRFGKDSALHNAALRFAVLSGFTGPLQSLLQSVAPLPPPIFDRLIRSWHKSEVESGEAALKIVRAHKAAARDCMSWASLFPGSSGTERSERMALLDWLIDEALKQQIKLREAKAQQEVIRRNEESLKMITQLSRMLGKNDHRPDTHGNSVL